MACWKDMSPSNTQKELRQDESDWHMSGSQSEYIIVLSHMSWKRQTKFTSISPLIFMVDFQHAGHKVVFLYFVIGKG